MHDDQVGTEAQNVLVTMPLGAHGLLLPPDRQVQQDIANDIGIRAPRGKGLFVIHPFWIMRIHHHDQRQVGS
jgi:hypothetical protein